MRSARRSVGAALLLLVIGLLVAARLGPDLGDAGHATVEPQPLEPIRFTATLQRNQLTLAGTTVSDKHEAAMATAVADLFPNHELQTAYRSGLRVPAYWETITKAALQSLSGMQSAEISIQPEQVGISGVTHDTARLQQATETMAARLPASVRITTDVITINADTSLDGWCRRAFAALDLSAIGFEESSTTLKSSSLPLLDRLSEFAFDCPESIIAITGHSDASGNAAFNLSLSTQRAQVVADYLIANGIPPTQFEVIGKGGAEPIADNATRIGRERNRRIEVELR